MAQGLVHLLNDQLEIRICAPEEVLDSLSDEIAVLMLTDVDYRTGRRHDISAISKN